MLIFEYLKHWVKPEVTESRNYLRTRENLVNLTRMTQRQLKKSSSASKYSCLQ